MAAAYRAGSTIRQLAERFRVNRATVMAILDRHGVPTRYRLLSPEQVAEAARLYRHGESLATIGQQFQVSPSTVRNALLANGGKTRPRVGRK